MWHALINKLRDETENLIEKHLEIFKYHLKLWQKKKKNKVRRQYARIHIFSKTLNKNSHISIIQQKKKTFKKKTKTKEKDNLFFLE